MGITLLSSVFLSLLAGSCAYLFFLNRYLIEIRDRGRKFPVIAISLPTSRYDASQIGIIPIFLIMLTMVLAAALFWQVWKQFQFGYIRTRLLIAFIGIADETDPVRVIHRPAIARVLKMLNDRFAVLFGHILPCGP